MRSTAVRAKLIDDASLLISLHHIVGTFNLGTHVQCACGHTSDNMLTHNRHVAEIIVDRSELIENMEES